MVDGYFSLGKTIKMSFNRNWNVSLWTNCLICWKKGSLNSNEQVWVEYEYVSLKLKVQKQSRVCFWKQNYQSTIMCKKSSNCFAPRINYNKIPWSSKKDWKNIHLTFFRIKKFFQFQFFNIFIHFIPFFSCIEEKNVFHLK